MSAKSVHQATLALWGLTTLLNVLLVLSAQAASHNALFVQLVIIVQRVR